MSSTQLVRNIFSTLALLYFGLTYANAQVWRSSLYSPIVENVVYSDTALVYMTDLSTDSVYEHKVSLEEEIIRVTSGAYNNMLMELMVIPQSLNIHYLPTKPQETEIKKLEESFSSLRAGRDARAWINKNAISLSDIRRKTAVNKAYMVTTVWSEVPEPWRDAKDGIKMELTDNDSKSLAELFHEAFEAPEKMRSLPKKEKSPWELSGEENLQMSQMFVNKAWAKGGEKNVSLSSDMRAKAVYTKKRHSWESSGIHKVGFTHTSVLGTRVSNDAFELSTKYGFKAANKWYYSYMTTFKTQLFRNYANNDVQKTDLKSTMLSPAYLQLVVGMDYKVSNLSILLSPYTASITVVADTSDIDQTKFGISKNRRSSWVNGFSVNTTWTKTITYGVTYSTKMELFYEYFEKNGQKRFNWENVIDMQINRFLTTRLLTTLRFFDNEREKFQIKENFTIAFKYKF